MVATEKRRSHLETGFALDTEIADLQKRVEGSVLVPDDAEYDVARRVVNILSDRYPLMIVRAANENDVAEAVRFSTRHGIQISVRSGGHSISLASVIDDAMLIDLSQMRSIRIDPVARIARVQPGANSGDLGAAANPHGLALTTGDTYSVGLGGLVTGGGIGYMVRQYGLTIDSLLSVRIVTADGEIRTASAIENPDLFWAVRGGGGNFGIVTEFTFRMAPVGNIYGGELILPATPQTVRAYLDLSLAAPEPLSTIAQLLYLPPFPHIPEKYVGQPVLQIIVCWTGDPADGEAALAPFREIAEPYLDTLTTMPYPEIYKITEHVAAPHGVSIRSTFARDFSDEAIVAMLDSLATMSSPFSLIQLRGLGGFFSRVDPMETAFPHRDSNYFLAIIAVWLDPSEEPAQHQAWTSHLWDRVKNEGSGVYVNFLENEGESRIREAYLGQTYERLQRIKDYYDPNNVFRFNQNVHPSNQA